MGVIRTLILSGGGGRGAFHAGVYKYLCQELKQGVDGDHQGAWTPDIVVGTSIGAVNGAAIVQGMKPEELIQFWQGLREEDIEGLPPSMTPFSRWMVNMVLKDIIGVPLLPVPRKLATSPGAGTAFAPLPKLGRFGNWLLGRWSSLLDTGPLRQTITQRMGLDENAIRASDQTLLINATNVSTGRRMTFSNRPIYNQRTAETRRDVTEGITIQRILASCSIPLVYPWTADAETRAVYWDGAVVNNTPIGVAMDAAGSYPREDRIEAVVVMMTPWRDLDKDGMPDPPPLPRDFSEAVTWALDWALLASFRERLDLIEAFNKLGRIGRRIGDEELSAYREIRVTIIAPEDFFPAARILDYDQWIDTLIQLGYQAAARAFRKDFAGGENG
jgi:NTE family protein